MSILLKLFDLDPSTKVVFGFKENQDVVNSPMNRMGILIHAKGETVFSAFLATLDLHILEEDGKQQ